MQRHLRDLTTITVLGFGLTGVSCARYLLSLGITPIVLDTRKEPPGLIDAADVAAQCETYFGPLQLEHLLQSDLLLVSPGIDRRDSLLQMAADAGVEMISDIELFAWEVEVPVVGVTGSNGKSTVVELTTHILRQCGINAVAAGNIGTPVLDSLLPGAKKADCYVLELSSFQLELVNSLQLTAATILNISSDHLDRYDDERGYERAKHRIYQHTKLCVWNRDDTKTKPLFRRQGMQLISFGSTDAAKDFGITTVKDELALTYANKPFIKESELPIQGTHNLLNVQVAVALAQALGVNLAEAVAGLAGYKSLPHRCELVGEFEKVRWIDDSKATNPGATIAAIEGIRASAKGKLILIAGGDAKGADLSVLKDSLAQVDILITLGRDGDKIAEQKTRSRKVHSLNEAVAYAAKEATENSVVLLSPACASLDMFKNYAERGQKFREAVEAWYALS
ncbi:UDP-N-acetylmuramoylalanine--D-glutamate ligase [Idiomarina sp. A28L]|uniref:UDP-N-acetylmuramoyl-L-alanine--D-glutamate ligase n=1 Tax=Idiomarina sp. A28L TaxID=1036674 RepID=UPI00021387AA|nr:UDP-N-acetylmuramoyl-L-alanine--D-glutamate ligase [Idiomarina sp. A28L]EGN74842.1 UDP-N-acetylmuramoylalanine--D-glutamate ligase [Idiomarina sp. A28L]